mmetsp:Transcript_13420/g.53882  ORF Transcript_13420/g.53882 Transcript_13420/m.53882 type:complete len:391 (-) Transcript_13420:1317-2489(-)
MGTANSDDSDPVEEDEVEPQEDYVLGGYHRVHVGDVYDERYQVLKKLGWGVYSTVWRCFDSDQRRYVALKIQKSAPEYTNSAVNEIDILRHIQLVAADDKTESHVVVLLEHFYVAGPNGNHVCMVFELLGETLLRSLQDAGAFSVQEACSVTRCLLDCLAFLHDRVGIVHTDVKPENVLVLARNPELPTESFQVKLVDFGTAFYINKQTVRDIQTREYRCPEAILGIWPFQSAVDVWSVGCLVFELLTGETLFDPQSPRPGEPFTKDESHLAQAIELLGCLPRELIDQGRRVNDWFTIDKTALCNIAVHPPAPGTHALANVLRDNFDFCESDAVNASAFLEHLLQYDPRLRPSARQALNLAWLDTHQCVGSPAVTTQLTALPKAHRDIKN